MIPDSHIDLLENSNIGHLATIGPHGEPQSVPVWYAWDKHYIMISQAPIRQKFRNIRRDPRVALSILDPNNPYRYLEVRGTVIQIEDDLGHQFIDSLAERYIGEAVYRWSPPDEARLILFIRPEHVTFQGSIGGGR